MIMGWISKVAGPKVLLGVAGASVLALLFMWWQLSSAWADEAKAQANSVYLNSELRESEQEITDLLKQQEKRERAVTNALDARERAREEAEQATTKLEKALGTDECANTRHPDAVTDSLRLGAGSEDKD